MGALPQHQLSLRMPALQLWQERSQQQVQQGLPEPRSSFLPQHWREICRPLRIGDPMMSLTPPRRIRTRRITCWAEAPALLDVQVFRLRKSGADVSVLVLVALDRCRRKNHLMRIFAVRHYHRRSTISSASSTSATTGGQHRKTWARAMRSPAVQTCLRSLRIRLGPHTFSQ